MPLPAQNMALQPENEEQARQSSRLIALVKPNAFWEGVTLSRFIMVGLGFPLLIGGLLFVCDLDADLVPPCCFGLSVALVSWVVQQTKQAAAIKAEIGQILEQTEDPMLISYIVDLKADYASKRRSALLRLLPKLSVKDTQRLRSEHWELLHRELHAQDTPMIIAILEVIQRCGSIGSLRYVRPLAAGNGSAKQNARIQQLAEACETKLQARLNRLDNPQILLRGSAAPAAETLLRPVMGNAEAAPQQLLRAAGESDTLL